jgi:hypothetical protein
MNTPSGKVGHLMKNIKNAFIAALAAAALITPSIASAQDFASSADNGANQQIQGTISSIDGTWNLTVNDANGYSDNVALHQGTIINPTGLTLEDGMNVTIDGYPDGSTFDAIEIDTPYQYQGPAPVAVYYGPGNWYPGYASGWGPSFSLFFDVGSRRFEQRSFNYGGQIRRPMAPPSGWENRPHGFIGNAGYARNSRTAYAAPQQQRSFAAPQQQRSFAAPQQQRSFAAPQQQRSFAAPQQQRSFAAPQQQRSFAAPQQQRSFAAPQQQRSFAAPQQQRSFAAPQQQRSFAAPQQQRSFAAPQQQRSFAAPQQQARSFSAPASRAAAPARGGQDRGDHQRG